MIDEMRDSMQDLIDDLELVKYNVTSSTHKEIINTTIDTLKLQKSEIDILIRKKDSLRDELGELKSEIERLKELEYAYNSLFK